MEYINKIEALLRAMKAPQNCKSTILVLAKRAKDLGYKQSDIVKALEMGLAIQNGASMSITSLPGTGYSKGAASFFLEQVLPLHLSRRGNNYLIRISSQSAVTINLN